MDKLPNTDDIPDFLKGLGMKPKKEDKLDSQLKELARLRSKIAERT